ncbi:hypothetical protein PAECIP111802_02672 [Paenibacillus allorhizosphaerae]|uniref:eCIS core domain-containing protein n=1 Tax=Paenibacillus allorhizosphaerae TaxID=2849866 RepID=A0ABM8VH36_9BACL|nr:hypothetical protein PAECIP111802_02672 [Paenibacillus allorhizosphaerae]
MIYTHTEHQQTPSDKAETKAASASVEKGLRLEQPSPHFNFTQWMQLQKTIGNRAVTQLMKTQLFSSMAPESRTEEQPDHANDATPPIQLKDNQTGIPDDLKDGLETLSGIDLSGVRVHYNSPKPSQVQALAYAQGTDIHLGPGQEQHLPHEGWHVVQQLRGGVQPTSKLANGILLNDEEGLENEADTMGAQALHLKSAGAPLTLAAHPPASTLIQRSSKENKMDFTDDEYEEDWEAEEDTNVEFDEDLSFTPVRFSVEELVMLMNIFDEAFEEMISEHELKEAVSVLDVVVSLTHFVEMHEVEESPYTAMTGHAFFNLAQNIVGSSEPYAKLKSLINKIRRAGASDKSLIELLLAKSYKEFSAQFDTIAQRAKFDTLNLSNSDKAKTKSEASMDDDVDDEFELDLEQESPAQQVKRVLWMMVQLWNLESARRLSGGVWNTINAVLALGSASPDILKVFGDENVMSHSGASGKSLDPSPGKYKRYQKSMSILNRLLTTPTNNPALQAAKDEIALYCHTMRQHANYANASKVWKKANSQKNKMPLNLSERFAENKDIHALLEHEASIRLRTLFNNFMRNQYTGLPQARPRDEQSYDAINDSFLLWLINQAASDGHNSALDDLYKNAQQSEELNELHLDEDSPYDYYQGFAGLFADNRGTSGSTSWHHVSNLRQAYRELADLEIVKNMRIHSSRHSQHVDLFFKKYETSIPELASILSLFSNHAEGLRVIQHILKSRDLSEFNKRLELVNQPLTEYQNYFNTTMAKLNTEATKNRKSLQWEISNNFEKLTESGVLGIGEIQNANKATIMKYLVSQDISLSGMPEPDVIENAIKTLWGLWRVYAMIEVARNPGAGGLNLLTLHEGSGEGGRPLELEELFISMNLMSPPGIARNPDLMEVPLNNMSADVEFTGPFSHEARKLLDIINEHGIDSDEGQEAYDELHQFLYDFLHDVLHRDETEEEDGEYELPNFASSGWGETTSRGQEVLQGFDIGSADGTGNDCLIDTLIQHADAGTQAPDEELDPTEVRDTLVEIDVTFHGEMIDFYGDAGRLLLDHFTATYGFQVIVYEVRSNGTVRIHPTRGTNGPLLYILHRGLHFCPMTPKQ